MCLTPLLGFLSGSWSVLFPKVFWLHLICSFFLSAHGRWEAHQFYPSLLCEQQIRKERDTPLGFMESRVGMSVCLERGWFLWAPTSPCGKRMGEEWQARSWMPRMTLILTAFIPLPPSVPPPAPVSFLKENLKNIYIFIYIWLRWVLVVACGIFTVACLVAENWRQGLEQTFVCPCSQQCYSQQPKGGNNQVSINDEWINKLQWNIMQP